MIISSCTVSTPSSPSKAWCSRFLEDFGRNIDSQGKSFPPVTSKWCVERRQLTGWFVENDMPVPICVVDFGKHFGFGEVGKHILDDK